MAPQVSKFAPITEQVEKISCWKCGKKFKKQKYLNTHISYHHSFPCQSCGTSILGSTCRIHQRSTEESKVQFVENGNEGSQNELVGTATEDPEIEIIGVVSDGKVYEKIFPMEDEEVHEILDGLDHATPANNQVGHTHLNEHHNNHVAPAYIQVGLGHLNGHHNNHANLSHATPAHNQVGLAHFNRHHHNHVGQAPTNNHVGLPHAAPTDMYFDGKSMQLKRKTGN